MAKSYKGVNLNGDALMHYRTKGSRNGYSKNPNYRAVGQRATGRLINGRYVYDNPAAQKGAKNNWQQQANATAGMSMANKINRAKIEALSKKGAKNNWQQQANETSVTNRMLNKHIQKRTTTVNMPNNNTTHKAMQKHNIFTKGWDGAVDNSYANASARVAAGKRVSTPQRTQVASAKSKRDKAIAKGANNNWQQRANATAGMTRANNNLMDRKINAVNVTGQLGIMQNLDRRQKRPQSKSAKRSKYPEPAYRDENGHVYNPKPNAMGKTYSPAYGERITDPRYNVEGSQKIEKAKQEAARKAKEKETKAREKRNSKKQSLISKIKSLFSKKK